MIVELLYTSAPQGLKQGSRGFCTVLCTAGLPINLAQRLEALSAYRHLYQPGDARADANPVCYSHVRFSVGGRSVSVVSRIAAYGLDYSQRTNKLAHHLVFDNELPRCGPGAVLAQPIMRTQWDGQCVALPSGPKVNDAPEAAAACQAWQRLTGDAGWAGVVANAWMKDSPKPTWIIFSEAQSSQLIGLMREAVALLPEKMRWKATFSTYCTNLPPDVDCKVRCVVAGSDEARMSIARGDVIDLTKKLASPPDSPAVAAARLGKSIGDAQKAPPPKAEPIRPVPASATNTATSFETSDDLSQLENVQEYELQAEGFVRPAPTPKKLPPRPLVQPKHLKVPKPVGNKAEAISPIWFVGGVGALVVVLLLAVTVVMLSRSKTQGETASNGPDVSGQNGPEAGGSPAATPSTNDSPQLTLPDLGPSAPPKVTQPVVAAKLTCEPADYAIDLKDLKSTRLTQLKLEGVGQPLDPKKLKVMHDGKEISSFIVDTEGRVEWKRDSDPDPFDKEKIFDLEMRYDVGNAEPLKTNFKLTLRAGENPDLAFKIVSKQSSTMLEPYAVGTELTPEFSSDSDADEQAPGKHRKWVWERSDREKENWQTIAENKIDYTATLADLDKRLRLKLSYPTRGNRETVVTSMPIIVMPANTVEITVEKLLAASLRSESGVVRIETPRLSVSGPVRMSFGDNKTAILKNAFSLPLEKLLNKVDMEAVEREFQTLRTAKEKYIQELRLWEVKPGATNVNGVVQVLRLELFRNREEITVEALCTFAQQRQRLESFIAKLNRLAEIYKTNEGKLKDEEKDLRTAFIDSSEGYPKEAAIQPMQLRQPHERVAAIAEFALHWKNTGGKGWHDLAAAEQAFFTALSASLTKALPPMYANGKVMVSSDVATADSNPLSGTKIQRLADYPLALQLSIIAPPELKKKILAVTENKPPEAAAVSKAGPASVGTEDVTK